MNLETSRKAPAEAAPTPVKFSESVALAGLIFQSLLAALTGLVFIYTGASDHLAFNGSSVLLAETVHLVPGILVWLICFLQIRLTRQTREEEAELRKLEGVGEGTSSLFDTSQKPDAYTARGRLARLERWFVPSLTVLLGAIMGGVSALLLSSHRYFRLEFAAERLTRSSAFVVAFAFGAFVFSQYVVGLSRNPEHRKLRPAGAYLLGNSFFMLLCGISLALLSVEMPLLKTLLEWVIPALVGVLGLEYLVNFVLDFFRPRMPGQELRPPFDSRLLGIFAQPGNLWSAIADTLDYQFGFRVSKTWFVSFVGRLVLPILACQICLLLLLTCLTTVPYKERKILERFGKQQEVLGPGIHLKLPWPIDQVYSVPTGQVLRLSVGSLHHEQEPGGSHEEGDEVNLWSTEAEASEIHEYILVASHDENEAGAEKSAGRGDATSVAPGKQSVPVNVLHVSIEIHYVIRDPVAYFYRFADPARYLQVSAYRELVQLACSVDLHRLLGPGRAEFEERLRNKLVPLAEKLGIQVTFVGFDHIHPPALVASSYERINAATETRKRFIVEANRDASLNIKQAETQARVGIQEARTYRFRRLAQATAATASFRQIESAYEIAPELFRSRRYLAALKDALKGKRLIFVPAKAVHEENVINLKQSLKADFLNVDLGK